MPKSARGSPAAAAPEGPLAVVAAIDRPMLVSQQLETTLRVPADRRMLIGGMTYEIRPNAGEPNLYLFMKAVVQELRDDRAPAKAEGKPAKAAELMPGAAPQGPASMPKAPKAVQK
jgi:hypothetical protein